MDIKQMYKSGCVYEAALNEIRKGIVEGIRERLSEVDFPDVEIISLSPLIVIVKASAVLSNSWNLSAEYYISEIQTKMLIEEIRNKQTISEIKHFIETCISNGYIMKNSKNKMPINSAVKEALIEIATMLQ